MGTTMMIPCQPEVSLQQNEPKGYFVRVSRNHQKHLKLRFSILTMGEER